MSTGSGTSSSIKVLMAGASWRLFGSRRAGEILLRALSGDDEQNRMLAGMLLVKAGQRSFGLIKSMIETGEAMDEKGSVPLIPDEKGSVPLIRLLPDIGGEQARGVLERVARNTSGELHEAATECIDLLDRIEDGKQ